MICPSCRKKTVREQGSTVYTSNPPQWDERDRCFGCGFIGPLERVQAKTREESLRDEWKELNP